MGIRAGHVAFVGDMGLSRLSGIKPGRLGVFSGALQAQPATVQREVAAEMESLGYGTLWYGESAAREAFAQGSVFLSATSRLVVASGIASVLLVIPMFYLGKELFNRSVAFWATALFQCHPQAGQALSDGLSEGLFLLLDQSEQVLCFRCLLVVGWGPVAGDLLLRGAAYKEEKSCCRAHAQEQ